MASTKAYLDFVLEQLLGLDEISSREMMGEFILYYRGKVFGGIYDDRLLVKPVPVAVKKKRKTAAADDTNLCAGLPYNFLQSAEPTDR